MELKYRKQQMKPMDFVLEVNKNAIKMTTSIYHICKNYKKRQTLDSLNQIISILSHMFHIFSKSNQIRSIRY